LLTTSFQITETLLQINIWKHITRLGSASLLIPIIAVTAIAFWRSNQKSAVRIFLIILISAICITLVSKIIYLGWGLGIASLDFTGISGHTLLATAVLPIMFGWILSPYNWKYRYTGELVGLLLAIVVGVSRIVLGAHSLSEVVAGWIFGLIVCGATLKAIKYPIQIPYFFRYIAIGLLLIINLTTTNYLPTHDWELKLALLLSGHEVTYSRQHT
jgi:membrane-associated phospholipid phosphatase